MKKCSQLDISITIALQTKNSPVLDTGRCPKLKSDEFFVCKAIDIEISRCEHFDFSHSHYKFFGAGPRFLSKSDEFFLWNPFYYPHSHPSKILLYQKMRHLIGAGPQDAYLYPNAPNARHATRPRGELMPPRRVAALHYAEC